MIGLGAHWRYARYLARHKWFVFQEARLNGVPWLGLLHDWSKLRPDEWGGYAAYFYGPKPAGAAEVAQRQADFDRAWLLHQKRNRHHWQFWVLREDDGGTKPLPMPDRYRREMVADWRGAGRAITGNASLAGTQHWYRKNSARMVLHPETRAWVERWLGVVFFEGGQWTRPVSDEAAAWEASRA